MCAVPARERVEEHRDRLQEQHVDEGDKHERSVRPRDEPAVREREQRIDEHGEEQVRGQDADGVGGRAVRVVECPEQRGEADGDE
jgi:hypothetical protein